MTGTLPSSELITVQISLGEWADRLIILKVKADKLAEKGSPKAAVAEALYQSWLRMGQESRAFSPKGDYLLLLKRLTEIHTALWDTEESLRDPLIYEDLPSLNKRIIEKNNERHAVKRLLDEVAGHTSEPKEYA